MRVLKETKLKKGQVYGGTEGYEFLLIGTKDELEGDAPVNFVTQKCTNKKFFPSKVYATTGTLKTDSPTLFKIIYRGIR